MKKSKIISSLLYKTIERLGVKGFGLLISVVLARMLSPHVFGEIAIITVFINLSQTMNQSGLNTALVQKKNPSEVDYSTVFYITLALSFVFFGLIFVLAPFISDYYGDPALTLPLRVYAATLIFSAFNSVQIAKLQKEMRFKPMMTCNLIATILSGALGIIMAYSGAGLWALIGYYMSNSIFASIAILFVERWYPKLRVSMDSARELFSYGWKILVSGMVCSITADIRSLIIGKRYSTSSLGYYNRGQQFPEVISKTITYSVQSVMLPAMSDVQSETERLKQLLRKSAEIGSFIIIPAMFGLSAVAMPVVKVILSDKWLPCVAFMQCLSIADACIPLMTSNLTVIKASGRSDIYMKLEFARRAMIISILCISVFCFRSVKAIAVGYCISSWLDCALIVLTVKGLLKIPVREQFSWVWKTLLASTVMMLVLLPMSRLQMPAILLLALQLVAGVAIYLGLSVLLKNESVTIIMKMLRLKKK